MISLDEKKLKGILTQVAREAYCYKDNVEIYFDFITAEFDVENREDYQIKITGSIESYSENTAGYDFYKPFTITIEKDWSPDFIAGYFMREIEVIDEDYLLEDLSDCEISK